MQFYSTALLFRYIEIIIDCINLGLYYGSNTQFMLSPLIKNPTTPTIPTIPTIPTNLTTTATTTTTQPKILLREQRWLPAHFRHEAPYISGDREALADFNEEASAFESTFTGLIETTSGYETTSDSPTSNIFTTSNPDSTPDFVSTTDHSSSDSSTDAGIIDPKWGAVVQSAVHDQFNSYEPGDGFGEFVLIAGFILAVIILALCIVLEADKKYNLFIIGYNAVFAIFFFAAGVIILNTWSGQSFPSLMSIPSVSSLQTYVDDFNMKKSCALAVGSFCIIQVAVLIGGAFFTFKQNKQD